MIEALNPINPLSDKCFSRKSSRRWLSCLVKRETTHRVSSDNNGTKHRRTHYKRETTEYR